MPSRLAVLWVSLLVATPAVIFWIWLVALRVHVAIWCPEECSCDPGGYYVSCYKSSLNNIAFISCLDIQVLQLIEQNITSLRKHSFNTLGLENLQTLIIYNCELKTIEVGAFKLLIKLTHLLIYRNQISRITKGTFENMSRLEELELKFNRIEYVEPGTFIGLVNLKHIDLGGNKLRHLHEDMFAGLHNLERLDLAHNPDLHVPIGSYFINSHSLSRLDISGCNVRSVSAKTFAKVIALERLDLRDNNLSSVDVNILKALPKLSALYLYGNPLQCDCQLQEVWRWCLEHNIETDFEFISQEYDTMREAQGMWQGGLEKGQCFRNKIPYCGDYKNISYTPNEDKDFDLYSIRSRLLDRLQAPVYVAPFTFGTTSNVILLIIITCNKDMRTVPNMYILNLAVSDMIYLTVTFSEAYAHRIYDCWQYGALMCRFFQFCRRLSVGLSAYSVAVFSIQRYRVTVNPLHVRVSSQPTRRATAATICGVWIVAAFFALPSTFSEYTCHKNIFFKSGKYYQQVVLFELLVSCVLPLCVIAFCYIMMARHVSKSNRPISEGIPHPQQHRRKKSVKVVLSLIVVFLISYVPYHAYWIIFFWTDPWMKSTDWNLEPQFAFILSTCLLLINPCFNPVALFCTGRAFRRQFKRYLTCCCKANPTATDVDLTRRN